MGSLFEAFGYQFTDQMVGGYGSLHLYIATKSGEVGN
jgi:hypothetical protein